MKIKYIKIFYIDIKKKKKKLRNKVRGRNNL